MAKENREGILGTSKAEHPKAKGPLVSRRRILKGFLR